MSKNKELVKNTAIVMIGKIFTQFLSFFLLPLYTRLLPAVEYGTADLLLTYISLLAPVITVQQQMATFRYLVDARKDEKKQTQIIATSIESTFIRLLIFSIPCVIASFFINSEYIPLVLLGGIAMSISQLLLQVARGFGDNVKYAIGSVLSGVVTIASNLILICAFHFGGESILISMIIANFACATYLFISLKISHFLRLSTPSRELKKSMLKYSWPLVPNGISWWLINASDRTIVSAFLGVAANGIYAVANKFPSIISGFLGVFSLSWTESASVHINDSDRDEFFSGVARNTLRIFSSLSILVISIMPFVFNIVIGKEYAEAYNYIPIAIIAVLFNCMVSIYSAIYVAKKLTKKVAMTSILSAVINIVVDLALIKFIGLYASVISTAVAFASMTIYRHFDIKKYVKIKYNASDLISIFFATVLVCFAYYYDSLIVKLITLAFAFLFSFALNYPLIKKTISSKTLSSTLKPLKTKPHK